MTKNIKRIFFVTALILLLVSISAISATEATNDTSSIAQQDVVKEVNVEKVSNTQVTDTTSKNIKKEETTTDLYVSDSSGSDDNSGTQTSPYKTIQKALDTTNADSTFNIHILEGTYKGLGNTNLTVNGNYNINFIGDGINNTILDGEASYVIDPNPGYVWDSSETWYPWINSSGNYAMTINEGTGLITLSNITIQNMYSPGGSSISSYPHATVDNYANLLVDNVDFYSNHAGIGSAIRNNNGATLIVNNSFFENNTKSSSTGNDGIIYNNGSALVYNSIFDTNYARWSSLLNDKNLTVINTTFKNAIAYDGNSAYRYGTGVAANTGGADFFNPGFFLTYTNIINCTFINNQECDIYIYSGNLIATGNKFINSTGINIADNDNNHNLSYLIDNNTFENMQSSSVTKTLSSNAIIFAIRTAIDNNKLVISNNNITSNNGTMIQVKKGDIINNTITLNNFGTAILVNGIDNLIENNTMNRAINISANNNTIRYNKINTTDSYTINILRNMRNNTVTDNDLVAKLFIGDYSVSVLTQPNIVENNTPTIPDNYIFVSQNATRATNGTMNNPTTLTDALLKVENNGTICLIPGRNSLFTISSTLNINSTNIKEGTNTFTIKGMVDDISMRGYKNPNQVRIFNISEGYTVTLENINFTNSGNLNDSLGGIIYSEGNINVLDCKFDNSTAEYGGAIYVNNNADVSIQNSIFTNIKSVNETIYLNNTGNKVLLNNTYFNSSINTETLISSESIDSTNRINQTITIEINSINLTNPSYYDENILNNVSYNIYVNDELINTTTSNTFEIMPTTPENLSVYIIPSFTTEKSNTLNFEVKYDENIKIEVNTPDIIAFTDLENYFKTTLTDEFNLTVKNGKVSYYNDETLIATVDVENGTATYKTPLLDLGQYNITIKYEDSEGIYENSTTHTTLTVLDYVYVSPSITSPQIGTRNNPTTLEDAITKVLDNHTIILLNEENKVYYLNNTLTIDNQTLQEGVKNIIFLGENVTIDGQNKSILVVQGLSNETVSLNFTFKNITFINSNNIFNNQYGCINLENVNLYNNTNNGNSRIYILRINGTNNFINNTGRLFITTDAIVSGNNLFENNTGQTGEIFTMMAKLYNSNYPQLNDAIYQLIIRGENKFINNHALQANRGGLISPGNSNVTITESNTFINNSADYGSIFYSTGPFTLNVDNITVIDSNAREGSVIYYTNNANITITNSKFINCKSNGETNYIPRANNILENNTYVNCSIRLKGISYYLILNNQTNNPTQTTDDIILDINESAISLVNPSCYDADILENMTYNIFINDELKTNTNNTTATIQTDITGDNIIYFTPDFSNYKSNQVVIDVEYENLKNTIITVNNTFVNVNNPAVITVKVTDKENNNVENGIITIYDENNNVLGTNNITNGITTITTTNNLTQLGICDIRIDYNSTNNYNNQTTNSQIIVTCQDVYVSPTVTTPQNGLQDNPTTLIDAITKVGMYGTIHLLINNTNIYNITETITINTSKVSQGVTSFNITAEENNITFDGQGERILEIAKEFNINITNISFINSNDSAIYNNGTLTISGKSLFDNNNAENYGGAIYNNGTLIINGEHSFTNNGASSGAAIYSNGNIEINGNNNFINNTAIPQAQQQGGAAIHIISKNLTINGTNTFTNNVARGNNAVYGGAILSAGSNAKITITGENTFDNNQITSTSIASGGAIYSRNNLTIEGHNIFTNNSATDVSNNGYGGAIYVLNSRLNITGDNYFANNQANSMGGTIDTANGPTFIIGNNTFTNSTSDKGGIIYTTRDLTINGNNTFTNSKANIGGAIYQYGNNYYQIVDTIENTVFENITAQEGGAIYTTIKIINFTLTNNTFNNINSNNETLNLGHTGDNRIISDNTFTNCSINIDQIQLTSPQENTTTTTTDPITLNINTLLTNPTYYDENILDNNEYQIILNDTNIANSTETEYSFTPENYGTYNIHVYSTIYNTESNNITINVIQKDLVVEPITATIGDTINITATITVNDETMTDLSKGKVTFKVNGKTLKDANGKVIYAKVVNGTATIENYVVPEDWAKDGTTIQAVYSGSTQCEKLTSEKTNITVTPEETTLTITPLDSATPGQTTTLTATLSDNTINTGKIVFKINGKTVKDANGKVIYAKVVNGTVSVDYTLPESYKAGNYTVTATFITSGYDKIVANTTMTVEN